MVQDLRPTKPNGWLYGCLKAVARTRVARALLPPSLRPHRILSGPLRGCRIVTSWRDYPAAILGRTEIPLLDWCYANARPGQTWLDVGAQYGYTAIALAQLVGSGGRVFAFEPMLSTAGCLGQTRMLNDLSQITVLPLALGNCAGLMPAELEATHGMVDSTLAKSGREGQLVHRFIKICTHQTTSSSNFFQRWTTGAALIFAIPNRILSLSSALDLTRICRRKVCVILPKSVSTRLSQEPCLGV